MQVPLLPALIPRQRKALEAVRLIRSTTEELIAKCKTMVDAEEQVLRAAILQLKTHLALAAPMGSRLDFAS